MKPRNLLLVGVTGFILLIIVGVGAIAFWGWNMFADQAKDALNRNSVCLQRVGEIYKIELDFFATGEADGEDVFVFRVKGSKGSGIVTAEFISVDAGEEGIGYGTLLLSSGETYNLHTSDEEIGR